MAMKMALAELKKKEKEKAVIVPQKPKVVKVEDAHEVNLNTFNLFDVLPRRNPLSAMTRFDYHFSFSCGRSFWKRLRNFCDFQRAVEAFFPSKFSSFFKIAIHDFTRV